MTDRSEYANQNESNSSLRDCEDRLKILNGKWKFYGSMARSLKDSIRNSDDRFFGINRYDEVLNYGFSSRFLLLRFRYEFSTKVFFFSTVSIPLETRKFKKNGILAKKNENPHHEEAE